MSKCRDDPAYRERERRLNRERMRRYRADPAFREKEKATRKPEWGRRATARWREKNPDYSRQYHEQWYSKNRDRAIAATLRWRAANYDRWLVAVANRRARKKAAAGSATLEQIKARFAYWGYRCWMCGGPADSIDHVIPLSRGGSNWPANLRPACKSCNSRKNARLIHRQQQVA